MIDNSKEYIICSAIWYKNGKHYPFQNIYGIDNGFVIGSFRHPMCIAVCPENPYMQDLRISKQEATLPFEWGEEWKSCNIRNIVQGFITSYGRFVNRKDAFKMALECGQIDRESILKTQGTDIDKSKHELSLYSEDIFPKQYYYGTVNGKEVKKVIDLYNNTNIL